MGVLINVYHFDNAYVQYKRQECDERKNIYTSDEQVKIFIFLKMLNECVIVS